MAFAMLAPLPAPAGSVHEDQITAQELAAALDINTRKIVFTFDTPVFAKADFVQVNEGHAVHTETSSSKAATEIPFYYIVRNNQERGGKMITFNIGGAVTMNSVFQPRPNPSARVHDAYPKIVMPIAPSKLIYIFLNWDPDIDAGLSREMPPDEMAAKMKQGYYLTVSFANAPFTKPFTAR
jgi:hypothetical protein